MGGQDQAGQMPDFRLVLLLRQRLSLLDSPGSLSGPEPPDLSGFTFGGDPVRWLWIVPILERDRQLAKEHGSASLVGRLAAQQRSWVAGPGPR